MSRRSGRLPSLLSLEEHGLCFLVNQITIFIKMQFKDSVIIVCICLWKTKCSSFWSLVSYSHWVAEPWHTEGMPCKDGTITSKGDAGWDLSMGVLYEVVQLAWCPVGGCTVAAVTTLITFLALHLLLKYAIFMALCHHLTGVIS